MKIKRFSSIIGIMLVMFFALALLLTYVSHSVYVSNLPLVQAAPITSGELHKTHILTGYIVSDAELTQNIYAPADLKVEMVVAAKGGGQESDVEIIHFNIEAAELSLVRLEIELYDLQLQAEKLSKGLDQLKLKENTEDEQQQIERFILENRIMTDNCLKDIAALEELISNNGILLSENCDVLYVLPVGTQSVSRGQLLLTYIPFPAAKSIEFELPNSERLLSIGTKVFFEIAIENAKIKKEMSLPISTRAGTGETWSYTVDIEDLKLALHHGDGIEITTSYISSERYMYVVPRSAVEFETEQTGYVYLICERNRAFGTEHYLRKEFVNIINWTDDGVALSLYYDFDTDVALYVRELEDGMAVRLW